MVSLKVISGLAANRLLRGETAAGPREVARLLQKSQARIVMGEDQHAHLCQVFIAAYMINMDMGVDQKPNFFVSHLLHRLYYFIRKRREQRVH